MNDVDPRTLSGILGFDSARFTAGPFGREPLHIKGAGPTAYAELVTIDELDDILSMDSTRTPYVRVVKDGDLVDPEAYTYSSVVARRPMDDLLDRAGLMEQFGRGATIVLDSIHHWLPAFRELCGAMREELGAEARATAFLSPPREQALEPHADSYEVFVLQIAGTKRWAIYPRLDPPPPNGVILDIDDLGDDGQEIVLSPGDLLYLPWGTPHIVTSLDTYSAHISIAVRPPTWGAVLRELLEPVLADGRLDGPALMGRGREDELAAELSGWLTQLATSLAAVDRREYAEFLVGRATEPAGERPGTRLAKSFLHAPGEPQ